MIPLPPPDTCTCTGADDLTCGRPGGEVAALIRTGTPCEQCRHTGRCHLGNYR